MVATGWPFELGPLQIFRYRNTLTGEMPFASEEEAATFASKRIDQWEREDAPVPLALRFPVNVQWRCGSRGTIVRADLKTLYGLANPPKLLRPNWAAELVNWLADPRLAGF
ncbi:MAG: hypothetical protein U0894_04275 [Pirellulales bacterium]